MEDGDAAFFDRVFGRGEASEFSFFIQVQSIGHKGHMDRVDIEATHFRARDTDSHSHSPVHLW